MNWTGEKWENEAKDIVLERLMNDHELLAELMIDWFCDLESVDIASLAEIVFSDNENGSVDAGVMQMLRSHFRHCMDEYMRHGNGEVEDEIQYLRWARQAANKFSARNTT